MAFLGGRGSTGVEIEAQSLQMAATATPGPQLQAPCHGQPPSAAAQRLCCLHCSVLPRPCCPQLTFAVFIPYVRQLLDVTGLLSGCMCASQNGMHEAPNCMLPSHDASHNASCNVPCDASEPLKSIVSN